MIRSGIVAVCMFALLASPVFAVASLSAVRGGTEANGYLDTSGNWVWKIRITPTGGSSASAEIGFRETTNSDLISVAKNAVIWDHDNAGLKIFGWEPTWNGNPSLSDGMRFNDPTDEIFSALGSPVSSRQVHLLTTLPLCRKVRRSIDFLRPFNGWVSTVRGARMA